MNEPTSAEIFFLTDWRHEPTSAEIFFLTDWRHMRRKRNTFNLLKLLLWIFSNCIFHNVLEMEKTS